MNVDKLLLTPEGRSELRARHTCMKSMSSLTCAACNEGVPYPHPSIDEIFDSLKPRPTGSASGREPCLSKTNARPAASTPGQELFAHACPKCGYDPSATVTATISFLIKRDPPSLNRRLVNTLTGGRLYRQEKSAWMLEIRAARLEHKIPYAYRDAADRSSWPVVAGKRRVTLERSYSGQKKERDIDNLIGGMKPCVDSLVAERILLDDSPAHAEVHYKQRRTDDSNDNGLRIELEILGTR